MKIIEAANLQRLVDKWTRNAEEFAVHGQPDSARLLGVVAGQLQGLVDLAVEVEL